MKKIILPLAIMLSMITAGAFAQHLKFGIKVGTDIKKLTGKSFDDQFSYGYHVGAFTEIGFTSKFGIQPELYFSQVNIDTSSHFSDIYNVNNYKQISRAQLKYINIPILLSYKPNKYVSLQAGPQYSILMNNSNTILQNGRDAFKKGDFSMLAGIQLNFFKVRVYGRYGLGLSNLNDIDSKDKWKSQTVQLGLGIAF